MSLTLYPCPACGFEVFKKPPGSHAICPVCGWEDDEAQLRSPNMGGGANKPSLREYQQSLLKRFPPAVAEHDGYHRAKDWRSLMKKDFSASASVPRTGREYFDAVTKDDKVGEDRPYHYYWQHADVFTLEVEVDQGVTEEMLLSLAGGSSYRVEEQPAMSSSITIFDIIQGRLDFPYCLREVRVVHWSDWKSYQLVVTKEFRDSGRLAAIFKTVVAHGGRGYTAMGGNILVISLPPGAAYDPTNDVMAQ